MGPKPASDRSPTINDSTAPPSRRVKGKRTRTGCLTCRARKVKCDEQPGTCANCERVCLQCRWPEIRNVLDDRTAVQPVPQTSITPKTDLSPQLPPSSGPIRRNRNSACVGCRTARARCTQDVPSCGRCAEQGIHCEYAALNQGPGATPSSIGESPSEADHEPWRGHPNFVHGIPRPVVDRHIEAFFTHVYPVQGNAIVHRASLTRDITEGTSSQKVVLAICAVASRFVDIPGGMSNALPQQTLVTGSPEANRWAAEAKADVINSDMSIDNITAALILAKHDIYSGRFSQAFVLSAMATRMAMALFLHREMPADADVSKVERETRRRLMYGCYSLDRMMSTGVPEFLSVPAHRMQTRLPCADQKFNLSMEAETPIPLLEEFNDEDFGNTTLLRDVGLFGQHIRLISIRANILRVVRNRDEEDLPPWDPASLFALAERKLNSWYSSLPQQFQLDPETVYARQFQNELTPLTMLHIWFHTNFSELTRISMPGFPESLPADIMAHAPQGWIQGKREECAHHARLIAQSMRHISNLVDMDTLVFGDPSLPICAYESARTRLQYAFLLPHELQPTELNDLMSDVSVMFNFIEQMSKYFKSCKRLLGEIRSMLRRHGLDPGSDVSEPSQPGSPGAQDPWSRRVRSIRDHAPRRPGPAMPTHSQSYPPLQNQQISAEHRHHHPQAGSLPTPSGSTDAASDHSFQGQGVPMYAGVQGSDNMWNTQQGQGHGDHVAALLGELGAQHNHGGGMGMGAMGAGGMASGSLYDMLADWVATGYDAGAMGLNGVV